MATNLCVFIFFPFLLFCFVFVSFCMLSPVLELSLESKLVQYFWKPNLTCMDVQLTPFLYFSSPNSSCSVKTFAIIKCCKQLVNCVVVLRCALSTNYLTLFGYAFLLYIVVVGTSEIIHFRGKSFISISVWFFFFHCQIIMNFNFKWLISEF